MRCSLLLVTVSVALVACGGRAPTAARPVEPAPPAAAAATGIAALPYTADQIRAASPAGRRLRFRMVQGGAPGTIEMVFTAVTEATATVTSTARNEAGAEVAPAQSATAAWAELAAHASVPAATTSIEDAEVETTAGRVAATKYVTRRPHSDGRPSLVILYFTKDVAHAGPPVKMLIEVGGAVVVDMTLVSDEVVPR